LPLCVWWPKRDNSLIFQIPKCLPLCLLYVFFINDIIAIKNCSRLMATDLHSNAFGYPCLHHIADSGSPKVMEKLVRHIRLAASCRPGLVKSPDLLTFVMKHVGYKVMPFRTPAVNDVGNDSRNHEDSSLGILGRFRP